MFATWQHQSMLETVVRQSLLGRRVSSNDATRLDAAQFGTLWQKTPVSSNHATNCWNIQTSRRRQLRRRPTKNCI